MSTPSPHGSAYEAAGVSQSGADRAVGALVEVLRTIDPGRPGLDALGSGHYASVLRLDERTGLALCTDGVGTKLLIAEQMDRWDTVGIDCIAMNVNDLICVGATPLALLDYIAVPAADPDQLREVAIGLKAGAEASGIEIPGGELAQVGELVGGLDLVGAAVGTVPLDGVVTGARVQPGDALIGLPSSGLHSNGYTLARRVLAGLDLDDMTLDRPLGEVLLEPTELYVKAVLELLGSEVDVRGLAHITGGGLDNLLRLRANVGYRVDAPLPVPPIFDLIQQRGGVDDDEMWEVFNMGCGFVCVVAADDADAAVSLLCAHHPGAAAIGTAVPGAATVDLVRG